MIKPIYLNNEVSKYAITEYGDIINTETMQELNHSTDRSGHEYVTLYHPGIKVKHYLVHRLVADAYIPNPEGYPVINHIDGNPHNNHCKNLEWCTQKHNILHAYRTGLNPSIGVEKAKEIIKLLAEGYHTGCVAKMCGVTKNTVDSIYYRNAFSDISKDIKFPSHPKGCENNNTAVLSNAKAAEIISVLELGKVPPKVVAYIYQINPGIVSNIYQCKTWRKLETPFSGKRCGYVSTNHSQIKEYIDLIRPTCKNEIEIVDNIIKEFNL